MITLKFIIKLSVLFPIEIVKDIYFSINRYKLTNKMDLDNLLE